MVLFLNWYLFLFSTPKNLPSSKRFSNACLDSCPLQSGPSTLYFQIYLLFYLGGDDAKETLRTI